MRANFITSFAPLVLLVSLAQIGLASDFPCSGEAASHLSQIRERWQWEIFWEAGIKGRSDVAGKRIHTELFWNRDEVGFCSLDLGSCAKYAILGEMLGQMTASTETDGQRDLGGATEAFLNGPVLPPVITRAPPVGTANDRTGPAVFRNGKQSISLPGPSGRMEDQAVSFHACTTEVAPPSQEPPESIKRRIRPGDLAQVRSLLTHIGQNIPAGKRASTEFLVPFYAETDPMIYVLVRAKGSSDSIIFLVRDGQNHLWKVGGHFEEPMGRFQLDKLAPKIRSSQMVAVRADE
jgi:hypothetical protein